MNKPKKTLDRYDTAQPWIVWQFGLTHDKWWPPLNSTRVLGRMKVKVSCLVCGTDKILKLKIPRFGEIPDRGEHPARTKFKKYHFHKDKGHPMSWARPLANPAVFNGGIPLDLLAMRLEGDMSEGRDGSATD